MTVVVCSQEGVTGFDRLAVMIHDLFVEILLTSRLWASFTFASFFRLFLSFFFTDSGSLARLKLAFSGFFAVIEVMRVRSYIIFRDPVTVVTPIISNRGFICQVTKIGRKSIRCQEAQKTSSEEVEYWSATSR